MNRLYRKLRNHLERQKDRPLEYYINQEMPKLLEYEKILGQEFTGKLLDLGCGLNYFSQACALRKILAEGLDLDKCDFEKDKLPFPDESFNIITMHDVVEHIWNPRHLFEEINRVLVKGGILIIRTHDWVSCWKTFYNDPTRKRPYTEQTFKKVFMTFGMKIRTLETTGGRWPWSKKRILAIAQRMK